MFVLSVADSFDFRTRRLPGRVDEVASYEAV